MIFFLFLYFFPYIHGDCLEFTNNQLVNECLIQEIENHNLDIEHYYPECLQCKIQTFIKIEDINLEVDNKCLSINLQCIQMIFTNQTIFEDFFQFHQQFISDLFNTENGTEQNTLHIIIKENTFEEINAEYIEKLFQLQYQSYRALFFEIYIKNLNIKLNRNLRHITRLSMKIILNCGNETNPIRTIYIVHNHNITLEMKQDYCLPILIPPLETTSNQVLSISHEKSKDIVLIIILLTGFLLFSLVSLVIYILKCFKRRYKKVETTSELSISQDTTIETPIIPNEQPKVKKPSRGMRAVQLFEDDI